MSHHLPARCYLSTLCIFYGFLAADGQQLMAILCVFASVKHSYTWLNLQWL